MTPNEKRGAHSGAPLVVRALAKQKAQQAADRLRAGPHWQDHGLIFTTALGGRSTWKVQGGTASARC